MRAGRRHGPGEPARPGAKLGEEPPAQAGEVLTVGGWFLNMV
jgi:hypothetical protein